MIAPITLEAIADAVLAAGLCTVDELDQTVDDLYALAADDGSVLSTPARRAGLGPKALVHSRIRHRSR